MHVYHVPMMQVKDIILWRTSNLRSAVTEETHDREPANANEVGQSL